MRSIKKPQAAPAPLSDSPWNTTLCRQLLEQLWALRSTMLESEKRYANAIARVGPHQRASARNLIHYLALRATDLRTLQDSLGRLGVSSLGRAESHVLANVDKVIGILHQLTGQPWQDHSSDEPGGAGTGRQLLQDHTELLLGPVARDRQVRIMVTLASEAATDYGLVRRLVHAGMDIARINCAHDDAAAWAAMAHSVRRAAKAAQREVRILMDLGGPKIRTGDIAPGPMVLKLKPLRDDWGHALSPSRLHLVATAPSSASSSSEARVVVDAGWLARLRIGKQMDCTDARGKKRRLLVVETDADGFVAESMETCYLTPDTALTYKGNHGHKLFTTYPSGIAALPGKLHLHRGDRLQLCSEGLGHGASTDGDTAHAAMARIACTMPQVFEQVRAGERIWFDDGRIGGVVRKTSAHSMEVEFVQARDGGESLLADKGINFPDSHLDLPALTEKDLQDLETVVQVADMVGLSFVQEPADVQHLLAQLQELGGAHVGVVLKIETLKGFENLPGLMLAAMAAPAAGVMIARGDLAVECGYERMAEVQEEILWCSEAAHMPVIWATQVLETLAKSGMPSRAEISDAGMGVRAECVMLNKGPYITDAIRMLDDILRRMAGHHAKKTSLLRALRSWGSEELL
ncbi:MAG: pyruvate kinase [Rhodoferax sp.]|nr:pyruvate kinase [Rhodoferax sp.]